MSKKVTETTPEFSHRAGHVLESPYFELEYDEDFTKRLDEKDKLKDAIIDGGVCSYDDLDEECKTIWDRAEAVAIKATKEWEEFVKNDDMGYGRFLEVMDTNPGSLVDAPEEE